jgi:hypothetical protein
VRTIDASPSTKLLLSTGAELEVTGSLRDVEKLMPDAVRSSPGTLALLRDTDGEAIGVDPAHVVTVVSLRGDPSR